MSLRGTSRPAAPIWPPICTGQTYDHGHGCSWPLSPCLERTLDKCDDLPLRMAALQLEGTSLQADRYSALSRGRCVRAYPSRRRAQATRNRNRQHRTEIGVIDVPADSDDYTNTRATGPHPGPPSGLPGSPGPRPLRTSPHMSPATPSTTTPRREARSSQTRSSSGSGLHGHVSGPDHGRRRPLDHQRPRHSRLAPGNQVFIPNLRRYFIVEDTCDDDRHRRTDPAIT